MGKRNRAKPGTVSVECHRGMLRLRWRYASKQRSLSVGLPESRTNRLVARQLAASIELDIAAGIYDETLDKYRATEQRNERIFQDLLDGLRGRVRDRFNAADEALIGTIAAYGKSICSPQDASQFFEWLKDKRRLAASSRRRYRDTLRVINPDLFSQIEIERAPRKLPKPFTRAEVAQILGYFSGTHYGLFVRWQLTTGMRPSETIGLRWSDLDLEGRVARVEGTLRRSRGSSIRRERSTTKTGVCRVVPLPPALIEALGRHPNKGELVFTSPTGKPIDDRNFRRRYWKPALETLGIEYRAPYKTRSTAEIHLLAAGMSLVDVAAIAGHRPETLMRHYAGMVQEIEMPDLYD